MITDSIKEEITAAMRVHDELKVSTLKLLSSALHNAKIDKKAALTEEEEIKIVQKEAKKRKDAIEAYEKAGQEDRAEREEKELEILEEYLPKQLTDDELEEIVEKAIKSAGAKNMQDMGKVMSAAMEMAQGRVDGKKVMEVVKTKLS